MLIMFGIHLHRIQWVIARIFNYRHVLLLADVFEKFNMCLVYYGLDPCHYFSSPELSWDAMLKITGIQLELISYSKMNFFY